MISPDLSHSNLQIISDRPENISSNHQKMDEKLQLQQEQIGSSDLYTGAINIFNQRYDGNINNLYTSSEDNTVYYGLAGGVAGMGMKLIGALDDNGLFLSPTQKSDVIALVSDLGVKLNSSSVQNDTDIVWPISNSSNYIDLGWDFGLAGIGSFYVQLYNLTDNTAFLNTATKIYNSIYARINWTSGAHFKSNIHVETFYTSWYPGGDNLLGTILADVSTTGTPDVAFNGISLGTAGIAKSALSYLTQTDSVTKTNTTQLLNQSIIWLENQMNVTGSEISLDVADKYQGLVSTSWATGVSGIGDLFIDIYDYYDNSTYLNDALSIYNWLTYNISDTKRMDYTWMVNGTIITELIEYGVDYGIAGVAKFLLKLGDLTSNVTIIEDFRSLVNYLTFLATPVTNGEQYGERLKAGGIVDNPGSTSYAYGGGGIVGVIQNAADYLTDSTFQQSADKGKSYLLSQYGYENGYVAIKTHTTNLLENNPSIGYLGEFPYLTRLLPGKLVVTQTAIDFGKVLNNETNTKTVTLTNSGESPIDITLSAITTPFSTENQSLTLSSREVSNYPILFSPIGETTFSDDLTISSGGLNYSIQLSGQSYDIPSISISEGLTSGQLITKTTTIHIEILVTDSSGIDKAEFAIGGSSKGMVNKGNKQFSIDWTPNLANGTYDAVFTATDSFNNIGKLSIPIQVSIYTEPFTEKLFSTKTILILAGVTVGLVVAAIIITRRYMS